MLPYVDREKFAVSIVGITKDGKWYLTHAAPEEIADGRWETHEDNLPAFLSPNRLFPGLQVLRDGALETIAVDCVHPVMHGELCEDGALQGLLELCGIPYISPGVCASACSMDKTVTKLVAATAGVRQADYIVVTGEEIDTDICAASDRVDTYFKGKYPLFVKPASAGSSVGVSKVHGKEELAQAFLTAKPICRKIMIEEMISGREVEVAVLGNTDPKASVVGEVLAANDFYDFEAKYENAASRTVIPAPISEAASEKLRAAAVAIYRAMGCETLSRVDFFLLEDDSIVFNEINTIPGFTQISMYPKLWEATGLPYGELLKRLYELALERGCNR